MVADTAEDLAEPEHILCEVMITMATNLNDSSLHSCLKQGVLKVWQVSGQELALLQGKHDHLKT